MTELGIDEDIRRFSSPGLASHFALGKVGKADIASPSPAARTSVRTEFVAGRDGATENSADTFLAGLRLAEVRDLIGGRVLPSFCFTVNGELQALEGMGYAHSVKNCNIETRKAVLNNVFQQAGVGSCDDVKLPGMDAEHKFGGL
jgi:hypothetical protein